MKCQICDRETQINYGNWQIVSCSDCVDTDAFNSQSKNINPGQPNKEQGLLLQSNYKTALAVSQFVEFIGWAVVVVGVIAFLVGLSSASYERGASFLAIIPGLGLAIAGLFLVMGSQVTRATVDNADHTREILIILNKQL